MTISKVLKGTAIAAATAMALTSASMADGHQVVDSIHFLIPGGAGGGWDGTARGTGEALTRCRSWSVPRPMKTCQAVAEARPSVT